MEHDLNLLYDDLLDINERVSKLPVYPQLGWVWCFDIIKDIFDNHQEADADVTDQVIPGGVTLKQIFDKFYFDIDDLGIDMDLGGEVLEEVIRDWMFENDLLMIVEEEEDV
jgi:hypothetical protein